MTYSELAEIIDTFFTQNLILLTKQSEEESVAALRAYVEDSKALALQEQEMLGSPTNTPMMRHKLRAQLLSRQSEMKSLTRILYWLDKCDYYPFHQSRLFKAIKQRIATLSLPVPKEIHFMSLIQLDAIQRDYIKLWAQQNARNYRINIWMDSATLLAGELCGRIQEAAVKHASTARHISDGAFQTQLTDWQNKAYKSIVHTMSQDDPNQIGSKFCFDQAAILFLEENGLAKPGELEKMGQTLADNFQLSVKELRKATPYASHIKLVDFYQMKDQTNYSLYIKELALRGNLLVATDISRLLILQQHGGIYLNTDILPRLNEMLFSPRIKIDRHNQEAVMQIVLDELVHRGQMPGRAEMINRIGRGGYLDQLQEMDDRVKQPIQHIVNQALDQHQDLFMPLGELKVDPYFACSYANGNNKAIIAIKNSPFINRVLNRLAQIHQVIIGENIDGLNPERPIPRTTNEEIRTVLQAKRLQLNDKWLLSYRSEGMITGGISSSRQIVGIAAYQHAYAALLEQAGVVLPDRRQQLSPHKILQPYTQAFFPTEEAYLSRSRESRIKFFYNVFPQSSQYDSQYIIQLQDDEGVNQMARFLYNKNSLRTAHYLYQSRTGRLVEINIAPNFAFKNRTRIILIAHGTFMKTLGGEQIVQLLVNQRLLRRDAQGLFPIIERVSIVACYITEPIPGSTNVVEKAGEPFIEKLYQAFSNKKITVNSISTREKVVSVDVLGRKWTGLPVNPQAPQHHWLIDWALVKESNRKIIFIQKNEGGIISKRITLVAGNNMRSSILRTSYDGRFGVDYVIDLPTEQVVKLNGYLDRKTAKSVIKNMQRGTLFMAADSMALIAGMTESQVNHGIIVNGTEHDMTAFQQILRLTEHHNDYRNWLTEIDLLGGTQALKSEMERLFDSPQTAFMRLKERYLHDDFDLFCLDLSNPMSAGIIERDMRGTAPIEGIYLSKIEQYLSPTIKLSIKRMDGPAERLNKLNGVIDKIEANLVYLNKGRDDTPLYYHSALTNRSEQTTVSQNELAKKYTHERYLYKAQEHYADTLIRNYFTLPIVLCDALVSANGELLAENNLPADKWAPLLLAMKYDKKTKKYVVPYLHDDGIQEKWLSTDNDQFAEMQRFLQQQHETLTEDYPLFNGRLYPGKTEIASIGANAVFAIMAIQHWLHNGITVPGNTLLAKTLQVHTYLAMTQVTFNVTGDTTTLLQAVFRSVRIGDFFRLFQLIALPVGLVLSIADVAFNAIELSKAENQVQRHLSRTQLTFSVAGLSLFVGGVIASLLGATLLIIGLFIVGIALAVAGYFSQAAILKAMKNLDKAKVIGGYFNAMRAGWEQGGFTLARGILQPCEGVVVTQVDLRNIHAISVVFDTMGQSIKKKDAVDGTSQNYIDLYPLREVGRTVNTTATPPDNATGITTLILPTQPRAKITPKSTLGFNAAPIHREFQAMHFFFRQNSAFPFSIASDPVSGLPYFSVPTALELYYFFTNVDIVLGNHHYHLIAPGVDETSPVNPLINQPVYSKHLHYTLLAPEQGAATVVLVLNNQQAPIIIDCVNDQVNWIIEARHLKGVEQIFYPAPVSTQASVVKFIRRLPTTSSEHSQQLISTITLKDSAKTKLTVRMP
ncbi:TcdA/TcdB catalytic glycosyltransferase domain-containing protein [Candidatus Fukatsuia endosymbiont of Tuberolachnus salignus]|uniref:TcdA/TcdB catalytic glycosyltransferase domain-containing protein n=1 Tax=Candidatus Fukatsuia endosymbiont of Tuberolachnus salignus TaxID=3077957 RepID=UPI00313ED640